MIYYPTIEKSEELRPGEVDTIRKKKSRLKTKYVIRREGLPDMEITKTEDEDKSEPPQEEEQEEEQTNESEE